MSRIGIHRTSQSTQPRSLLEERQKRAQQQKSTEKEEEKEDNALQLSSSHDQLGLEANAQVKGITGGVPAVHPQSDQETGKVKVTDNSWTEEKVNCENFDGFLVCDTQEIKHTKYHIEHDYEGAKSGVTWSDDAGGLWSFGARHPFAVWGMRSISNAIPGETGSKDAVLNTFSDYINDALGIKDEGDRKSTMTDGYGKAWRHQTWQAILTIEYGEDMARELGDAQEYDNLMGSDQAKKGMSFRDLINNNYGRQLGKGFKGKLSTKENLVRLLNDTAESIINAFEELKKAIPEGKRRPFTVKSKGVQELFDAIN